MIVSKWTSGLLQFRGWKEGGQHFPLTLQINFINMNITELNFHEVLTINNHICPSVYSTQVLQYCEEETEVHMTIGGLAENYNLL